MLLRLKEHPSVSLAFPPVGWQRTEEQPTHKTTVLCMAKDGGDFIASWAFYIHEIGIGALHQELLPMFPLLLFWRGMKKILCERHVLTRRSSPPERGDSQFLGGLISSPGVPQGERGLEFSRRRKGQRFFPSTSLVLVSSFHLFFFFFSLQHLLFFLEPVYN